MLVYISDTAFLMDGMLIDVTRLQWEARNCGGRRVHAVAQSLTILLGVALMLRIDPDMVEKIDVQEALRRYYNER